MELSTCRRIKKDLEEQIKTLLTDFINKSGLYVTNVSVRLIDYHCVGSQRENKVESVNIEVDI